MPTYKINKQTFSGTGKVFDGFLAGALISLAVHQAAAAAADVAPLTNNAGGAADGKMSAIPLPANHILDGTDSSQKAATETALGTVRDGLSEIIAQLNAFRAVVPAFPALTDSTGGAAADGTVGAVTVTSTGVGTSLASAAGVRASVSALRDGIAMAAHYTNMAAAAVGVAALVDNTGGHLDAGTTFAAISLDTGTAVSGADATDTNAGVLATDMVATLTALRESITELATKLNAAVASTPAVEVVAG